MIRAEVVAHSLSPQSDELLSVLVTFPRIILAEVNTHRMLSKNTSSSRAIPFNRMVKAIQDNPFIPIAWQKEHSGMQGTEYITDEKVLNHRIGTWIHARDMAISTAEQLSGNLTKFYAGNTEGEVQEGTAVTKQLANRLLEPFMWTTMLITGSKEGWDNFFHLRCPSYQIKENEPIFKSWKDVANHYEEETRDFWTGLAYDNIDIIERLKLNKGQAEIHMMALAEAIWDARNESTPIQLKAGEWHIPFENKIDQLQLAALTKENWNSVVLANAIERMTVAISTAMAARTSYTMVGEEKELNLENLLSLHDRLINQKPPHSSPMEHCARAMDNNEYNTFIKGQVEWYAESSIAAPLDNQAKGWCYNLKGFIPYRYLVDNKL